MTSWTLAPCLVVLQGEVNAVHPDRPRQADGTIGDARHQAEKSDHNPNAARVVTAWDITTADFTIPLAAKLRSMAKAGDARIKYVIYRGQICSARDGWAWRPYSGFSQHYDHIHLSVSADPAQYDRTDPWHIFTAPTVKPPIPSPTPTPEDDMYAVVADPAGSGDYGTNLVTKFAFPSQAAKNEWAQLVGAKRITLTPAAFTAIPTVKETK